MSIQHWLLMLNQRKLLGWQTKGIGAGFIKIKRVARLYKSESLRIRKRRSG